MSALTNEINSITINIEKKQDHHENVYLGKEEKKMNDKTMHQKMLKQIERNLTVQVIENRIMVMK